ncbi:hypothetical protein C0995_015839 [Termitomyces sp. Mi166|nr:hypothetical protein C0995_015839 [Termitomyces sp. Mi166\
MIVSTPSKDYHNLALRTSPSYRTRHCTPPRRMSSPTTDLPSYDSPMLTPSPLRQQPLFPNPFNPVLADPDDFFLQSPFKSPAQAHHLHTVYTTKPQPIPLDDDDGSIFLSSSSSYSPFFPTSTSQPLRTPVKQIHRFPSRAALSVKQLNSVSAPLDSGTRIGVGTKRKSATHASTPIRQHNLTPLVISSQRVSSSSASDVVTLDRLAPLPAPKFVASTPQTKAETDAYLKRQTATLTRLKLSDFVEPGGDWDAMQDDSGCEMGDDDLLFNGSQDRFVCNGKGKEKEEVAEAISPGGHIIKRRARRRPLSAELLESTRSPSSPTKAITTQRRRNSGIAFPSTPHTRKRTTSGSSSSDVGSPAPRRRVSNTRPCPPKLTSVPPVTSHLSLNRQDSATLFFGPAIPQASNSVPASRSRVNSSLSVSGSAMPSTNTTRKTTNRHSYAGPGASNSNLQAWTTIQTRDPSPSPKSSPPATGFQQSRGQDDDEDMFFGGGPHDSSFVFSVTEGTPSPRSKKTKRSTLQSKYKPRDSGIALDDEYEGGTDFLNVMPGTSTSVGSIHSDIEDSLVTPGTGPEGESGWPSVFVTGTDDATVREGLDVDAFIMRTLAAASKNPEGKKKVPGTPVKKVKKAYLPAGQRAWQSAVAVKVGPRVDFEPKKGNGPRKSLPAKLPLNFDTDSEDDDDSPGKRENYAGLGIGRPSASTLYDGNPQTLRTRWLMRRSSSGAFSSGSESMSSSGTPTRPKNKGVPSFASRLSPLQKNALKLSMTRTASNSSNSSASTLNSPSIASSRRLRPIDCPPLVPDTYQQSEAFTEEPTSRFERDFVVDGEIGSGEFGKVIKVRCKNSDDTEVFAVKKSKRVEGPRHRLRLQEEVQVLRHLSQAAATSAAYEGNRHPNVLAYIDSWEENDALYIETELCTSGNLQQFLETFGNVYRKLSEDRVWKILVDLSNGLRFVHDAGVIHLDLKPSNIFVTGEGRLKIGDFGMATFLPRLGQFETVTGSKGFEREGDKRYLAPEVLQEDYYSKAADIFSLGMTILEAAANIVVPDQGEDWQRLRRDDFSQVLLDDSPELLKIIKQMMRQKPQERMSIHDVCGHGVVCRAREVMERMYNGAKRDTKSLLAASPFGRTEEGFLDEILGRAMDSTHPATPSLPFPLPPGLSMDPSSVDFRAFYPYTPNEVKHRKRTTTTQLRTLEAIFKRDTKPNGPLRVELAAQLGMTARGVQVWFQNRRAKEKLKATKAAKSGESEAKDKAESSDDENQLSVVKPTPPAIEIPQSQLLSTEPSSTDSLSSPSYVANEPKRSTWEDPVVDPQFLYPEHNLHAYRRGSLPVNAFPTADFSLDGPSLDEFDPLARRRSVDASLQRLVNNPYAPLARAKNGVIFGSRAVAPLRRSLCRTPAPRIASAPYRLDMRRASTGNFRVSSQSTAPPSPPPLSPYNGVRTSLPDHDLYAVSSRTISPPLPGPLPSPNFSFGAASTPSMVSTSSGDSECYSPDPQHYAYRESEQDEDEGTPASYYSLSRFGSITSIATSDSSLNSAYFPDQVGCYEQDLGSRRGSCVSGHFAELMSGLDVSCSQDTVSSHDHLAYAVHEDTHTAGILPVVGKDLDVTTTYPSPSSTVSPGGSPHPQGTPPPSVPISRSSELDHALQSQTSRVQTLTVEPAFTAVTPVTTVEILPEVNPPAPAEQYFYPQDPIQLQQPSSVPPPIEINKFNFNYDAPYLTESYPALEGDNISLHHQSFEVPVVSYDTMVHFDPTGQSTEQSFLYV